MSWAPEPELAQVLPPPGQAYEAARLRWANLGDVERLVGLWLLAYPEESSDAGDLGSWIERGGALLLEDRSGALLAALPWRESEGGWQVERVATHPSERGQGYGRWLMTKVEALAIRGNIPYLWLRLPSSADQAEQLPYYARMGYVEQERDADSVTLRKRVGGVWQTKTIGPTAGGRATPA